MLKERNGTSMFYYYTCKETNSSILIMELTVDTFRLFLQCIDSEKGVLATMASSDYDETLRLNMWELIQTLGKEQGVPEIIMNEIHRLLVHYQL
jgi:hypothetical protein